MAKRSDTAQPEIVAALRQVGASVAVTSAVGHGFPDLLVWYRGGLLLLEVKSERGRLTPAERRWHDAWGGPVHVVRSWIEALKAIGVDWRE